LSIFHPACHAKRSPQHLLFMNDQDLFECRPIDFVAEVDLCLKGSP